MLGSTSPRSRLDHVGVVSRRVARLPPQPLLSGVGFDQLDPRGIPAGQLQIADGLCVDRENSAGAAELRRHVAQRGAVRQRQLVETIAEELDKLADHAPGTEHLRDRQHQIGRGRAFAQTALELEADHLRHQHRDRLTEHGRFGLDPADAPAEHAEAVDHRGMRIGADHGVRIGLTHAASSPSNTTRARYSRLTWWTMPVSGGTTAKLSKAFWPQRRNM